MAQTTPIPEDILANVAVNLATITTAGNAYRNTVKKVDRQFINPNTIGRGLLPALAVFSEGMTWEVSRVGDPAGLASVLSFQIQGLLEAATNPATALMKFMQDTREALLADKNQGDNANTTHVLRVEFGGAPFGSSFGNPPFVAKPFVGFLMDVEVLFCENL